MPRRKKDPLTNRERDVLKGIRTGQTDKEIASDLGISEGTVGNHVQSILKRLRCRSRAQALGRWLTTCI